ncbi:MAG: hypothetical protein DWQ10_11625 [Calditrichaeota bacterium]|nr:MAG: hypothetical protein DWQ10_11625 [Calditrichota bacterium]
MTTSQIPLANWHDVVASPTIAETICDSLINNSL